MLYEMKRLRKAKYGFSLSLSGVARTILQQCAVIDKLREEVLDKYPESEETWWFVTPNSMGTVSINIYINDEQIYEKAKAFVNNLKEK